VDVASLLVALDVEFAHFLAGWRVKGLLEVGAETPPAARGLVGDLVLLVDALGPVSGTVLAVEVGESRRKAGGDAVLVVQLDGPLDRRVAEHVSVGQIFSNDARAGLVLLLDVVLILILSFRRAGGLGAGNVINAVCRFDLHLRGAQLGFIKKKSSFGGPAAREKSDIIAESDLTRAIDADTHVSFSKVTVADFGAFSSAETGVTVKLVIFPLFNKLAFT
jgi:hypothetical protein